MKYLSKTVHFYYSLNFNSCNSQTTDKFTFQTFRYTFQIILINDQAIHLINIILIVIIKYK